MKNLLSVKDIVIGQKYKVDGQLLLYGQIMSVPSQTGLSFGTAKMLTTGCEVIVTDIFNVKFIDDPNNKYCYKAVSYFTGTRALYIEYNGKVYDVSWNEFKQRARKVP